MADGSVVCLMSDSAVRSRSGAGYTFWVADAETMVDTEALIAANVPLRQADTTIDQTISVVGSALLTAEEAVFTVAVPGGPIIAEQQAAAILDRLRGVYTQLLAVRDMILKLLFWRERAAQIYATAEHNVEGLFSACRVASYATCGQPVVSAGQRWKHVPWLGRAARGVGLVDSLFAYTTTIGGSSSGSGAESLYMQTQVHRLAARTKPWMSLGAHLGGMRGPGNSGSPQSPGGTVGVLAGAAATAFGGVRVAAGARSNGVLLTGMMDTSAKPSFALVTNGGATRQYVEEVDPKGWAKADAYVQGLAGAGLFSTLRRPKETRTPLRADHVLQQMKKNSGQGEVEVLRHDGPRGRSWSVLVRGTKEWGPRSQNPHDMMTNLQEVAGEVSDHRLSVVAAMEMAGVGLGEPVELVGHSQGGIIVANMAGDPELVDRYSLTTVLTVGSPTGGAPEPIGDIRVLSLENLSDLVPGLDGQSNQSRPNSLTVYFDSVSDPNQARTPLPGDGGVHDKAIYIAALAALEDGAADRSVGDFLEYRRAALHLEEQTVSTSLHFTTQRTP